MFRDMRRKKQLLSDEESYRILRNATNGVSALSGDDDYPYAVPISYVYHDGHIYMHSAVKGHKIDAINRNEKVSFCVVEKDEIVSEEFTTYFRSVIAFGKARLVEDMNEKIDILRILAAKYSPKETEESVAHEIDKSILHINVIDITIEHVTGKESIELVRMRK